MHTQRIKAVSNSLLRNVFHASFRRLTMFTGYVMLYQTSVSRGIMGLLGVLRTFRVTISNTTLAGMASSEITPKVSNVSNKVILYLHGGGFVIGSKMSHQGVLSHIVKTTGIKTFLINYRLAPEHLYPAAMDDTYDAYSALLSKGYQSNDIIIMGDSAGGGLTLSLLLRLRNEGLEAPLCGVMLFPWIDYETNSPLIDENNSKDSMLTAKLIRNFAQIAFKDIAARKEHSLTESVLSNLPPIFVQSGSHDVLHDDSLAVIKNLSAVNNKGRAEIWEGMTHGWHNYVGILKESTLAINNIATFIQEVSDSEVTHRT